MKTITVRKDVTINTGNFENIKLGAEITTDELSWEEAWSEVEAIIYEQKLLSQAKDSKLKDQVPF
jgi:hypothetical protein